MPGLVASLQEDWEILFRFFLQERDRSTCVIFFPHRDGMFGEKKKKQKTFLFSGPPSSSTYVRT